MYDPNNANPILANNTQKRSEPDLSIASGDFLSKCNPERLPAYFMTEAKRHFAAALSRGVSLTGSVEEYAQLLRRNAEGGEVDCFCVSR